MRVVVKLRLFGRRKTTFKLKARKKEGNVTRWEDVGEFDHKVSLEEVSDTIEAYRADGYDAFRLEEVDEMGRRVRMCWVKYFKPKPKENSSNPIETLRKLPDYIEPLKKLYETLDSIFGGKSMSIEDMVAQIVAYETLKKELAERLKVAGVLEGSGGKSELSEIMELIRFLQTLQGGVPQTQQQPQQQRQRPTQQQPPTQPERPEAPKPESPEVEVPQPKIEELRRITEEKKKELHEKMREEAIDALTLCRHLGVCVEEESGG